MVMLTRTTSGILESGSVWSRPSYRKRKGENEEEEKILMIPEPCAARTAGVAHNPPLDRQASWHQCLTECRRVGYLVSMECAKREASEK